MPTEIDNNFVIFQVRKEYIQKTYKIDSWETSIDFLEQMAKRTGKLLKGGEPDTGVVAKMILNDWQRGKIPFYVSPEGYQVPKSKQNKEGKQAVEKKEAEVETESVAESTKTTESVKKGRELQQVQDFRKIRVGLEYADDDIKEMEAINEELLQQQKRERTERKKRKLAERAAGVALEDESSGLSDIYSEDEYDSDKERVVRRKAKPISKLATATGDFEVESDEEDGPASSAVKKKLTAKQKRANERAQKRKKIGSNFYEVSNVKNRNRNKKD